MATITFDTLKYVERLKAAGISEPQARAETEALQAALTEVIDSSIATTADINKLDSKMDKLDAKFDTAMARVEGKFTLLHWMIGFNLAFNLAILWKVFG